MKEGVGRSQGFKQDQGYQQVCGGKLVDVARSGVERLKITQSGLGGKHRNSTALDLGQAAEVS